MESGLRNSICRLLKRGLGYNRLSAGRLKVDPYSLSIALETCRSSFLVRNPTKFQVAICTKIQKIIATIPQVILNAVESNVLGKERLIICVTKDSSIIPTTILPVYLRIISSFAIFLRSSNDERSRDICKIFGLDSFNPSFNHIMVATIASPAEDIWKNVFTWKICPV